MRRLAACLLLILCHSQRVFPARILAVFHFPSYSHFVIGEALCKGLASRGHDVTIVSPYPQKNPRENYRDVPLKNMNRLDEFFKSHGYDFLDYLSWSYNDKIRFTETIGNEAVRITLEDANVQKLLKSNEKFDLVILEQFISEALFGICYHFKAPCVPIGTLASSVWTNRLTGNLALASYIPTFFTAYSQIMNFVQKLDNLYCLILHQFWFYWHQLPEHNRILHEHFPDAPHINNLIFNSSLVFLNSHPAVSGNVPISSNMVYIGGIHMHKFQGDPENQLPKDIQEFLDRHDEGVIYFALGSNLKSSDLSQAVRESIIEAFKRWGKPILWKFEVELQEKPNNVKIAKWFPQKAVLSHKNTKAFITHCGRLGTIESIYFGVPMVGIPIFADQMHNAMQMSYAGYGTLVDFKSLTADSLYEALVEITSNPRYSKETELRSKVLQKYNALEEGIKWIEHIVDIKDMSYLRHRGVDLPWYEFFMMDVIGCIAISILIIIIVVCWLVLRLCFKRSSKFKSKKKTN